MLDEHGLFTLGKDKQIDGNPKPLFDHLAQLVCCVDVTSIASIRRPSECFDPLVGPHGISVCRLKRKLRASDDVDGVTWYVTHTH